MRILFLTTVELDERESAASVRTLGLIREFSTLGWQVESLSPTLNRGIPASSPDVVVMDRFVSEERWGPRVSEQWPGAVLVTDTQDLHFLRRARQKGRDWSPSSEEFLRELASLYRSDLSLVISDFELELLKTVGVPEALLHYLPLFYPEREGEEKSRTGLRFIGNYRHGPNFDGLRWFVSGVWPLIRSQQPQVEFHFAGAFAPREISSLHDPSRGIIFRGQVESSDDFLAGARVNVAPLLGGAGMKGKILSGWASGTPCVSTPVGAEGMGSPFGGRVVDSDPVAFANACLELLTDIAEWERAAGVARACRSRFGWEARARGVRGLASRLEGIRQNLVDHRAQNVVGGMLRLSLNQGLKYFTKWIELKEGEINAGATGLRTVPE